MKAQKINQAEYQAVAKKATSNSVVTTKKGETIRLQDTNSYYCQTANGFWVVTEVGTEFDHYDIIEFVENQNEVKTMTYKELQATLKDYKAQGLTQIKLNATHAELQAEYDRLTAVQTNEVKVVEDIKEVKENKKAEKTTQVVKLTKASAIIKLRNGKTRTIKIESPNNVEDVIGYLNNDDDIKFMFKYYMLVFYNNEFLQKRYNVYFPTKQQMTDKEIDRQIRERYYESFECVRLLKQNELEVKQYIGSLRN